MTRIVLLIAFLTMAAAASEDFVAVVDPKSATIPYKVGSIFGILCSSGVGVALPLAGKRIPALSPEGKPFMMTKAFAAGVILATGFIHVLPDAFESLTSPSLTSSVWSEFPFTCFIAMVAALGTLMVESAAFGYYHRRRHLMGGETATASVAADEEAATGASQVHVHHVHAAGGQGKVSAKLDLIRHRVTTQVLELGIVVHSVIIGISLGTSQSLATIKPLLAALCFHQFFEGIGLGGCIAQAKYRVKTMVTMGLFFSLTTPVGIAIGIAVGQGYDEDSQTSLIVQGVFNSAAAGILIYMALVGLLASEFLSDAMMNSPWLQATANAALLMGAGLMSMLAKWA